MKIAALGPKGTYSAQAARTHNPVAELVLCRTIKEVVQKVAADDAEEGVVALENSIGGIVAETLDEMPRSGLQITREISLNIHHAICGLESNVSADAVKEIRSHSQALSQCANYLAKHYPNAEQIPATSTAAAIEEVAKKGEARVLAIGSEFAAAQYGLKVIDNNIEDEPGNQTNFIVISKNTEV